MKLQLVKVGVFFVLDTSSNTSTEIHHDLYSPDKSKLPCSADSGTTSLETVKWCYKKNPQLEIEDLVLTMNGFLFAVFCDDGGFVGNPFFPTGIHIDVVLILFGKA